jgi:hypothetical protein
VSGTNSITSLLAVVCSVPAANAVCLHVLAVACIVTSAACLTASQSVMATRNQLPFCHSDQACADLKSDHFAMLLLMSPEGGSSMDFD